MALNIRYHNRNSILAARQEQNCYGNHYFRTQEDWQAWVDAKKNPLPCRDATTGVPDVYVLFILEMGTVANLNWFQFRQIESAAVEAYQVLFTSLRIQSPRILIHFQS